MYETVVSDVSYDKRGLRSRVSQTARLVYSGLKKYYGVNELY